MSSLTDMDFAQALNPLYAFPIVAVIICAFIVYAFGFKSPVQPPSFDGIEEEKKISRKRKTKDLSKAKIVQNGKLNGTAPNKAQVIPSTKKKDAEKSTSADKPMVEKVGNEKKITKKTKLLNDKVIQEKKKEKNSQLHEDAGEDGWVQLVSKKGRKSRKKDEVATEGHTVIKALKSSLIDKSDENILPEDFPAKLDVSKKPIPEKKLANLNEKEVVEVASAENKKDKVVIIEADSTLNGSNLEKVPLKDNLKNEKLIEETSNKSKKKKKKNAEIQNADGDCIISPSESQATQAIPEIPTPQTANNDASVMSETPKIITGKVQESEPKELKSSNVVFDELAGKVQESEPKESKTSNVVFDELADLYPKEKEREQRKKKKVRRDH